MEQVEVGIYAKVTVAGMDPELTLVETYHATFEIVYVCEDDDHVGPRVEEGYVWECADCNWKCTSRYGADPLSCPDCGDNEMVRIDGDGATVAGKYCWYCDQACVTMEYRYICQEGCDEDKMVFMTPAYAQEHLIDEHVRRPE